MARRERAMTAAAGTFALLALLYLIAIEPAWKARERLGAELPRLRAQAAEVNSLAQEAKGLTSRGVAVESAATAKTALEQSLARANLGGVRVAVLDERRVAVSAKTVPRASIKRTLPCSCSQSPTQAAGARTAAVKAAARTAASARPAP